MKCFENRTKLISTNFYEATHPKALTILLLIAQKITHNFAFL